MQRIWDLVLRRRKNIREDAWNIYEKSCTDDGGMATVTTSLFHFWAPWPAELSTRAPIERYFIRACPKWLFGRVYASDRQGMLSSVNRPFSVAECLPLALFHVLLVALD